MHTQEKYLRTDLQLLFWDRNSVQNAQENYFQLKVMGQLG